MSDIDAFFGPATPVAVAVPVAPPTVAPPPVSADTVTKTRLKRTGVVATNPSLARKANPAQNPETVSESARQQQLVEQAIRDNLLMHKQDRIFDFLSKVSGNLFEDVSKYFRENSVTILRELKKTGEDKDWDAYRIVLENTLTTAVSNAYHVFVQECQRQQRYCPSINELIQYEDVDSWRGLFVELSSAFLSVQKKDSFSRNYSNQDKILIDQKLVLVIQLVKQHIQLNKRSKKSLTARLADI